MQALERAREAAPAEASICRKPLLRTLGAARTCLDGGGALLGCVVRAKDALGEPMGGSCGLGAAESRLRENVIFAILPAVIEPPHVTATIKLLH